jgi:N-acetylglucosamine kinase-like BadF-type ATPase
VKYYIGIDGGATKTLLCAAANNSLSLCYAETSGASWREYGASGVAQKLRTAVDALIGDGQIAGIAMGLPCYGESINGDRDLEEAVHKIFPDIPVYITNDVEVGWAGSMALMPGINIVAGTGSIAFGKDIHDKTARSGGWSEFFGDEGSCYWVGRKVMELFSKQSDGRLPKDELYEIVFRELKLKNDFDFIDIISAHYRNYRKQVASLQVLAEKAALAGASSAVALYDEAVRELSLLVNAVRNQLDFTESPFCVSYSGGLFLAEKFVIPQFSREIEKMGGKLVSPRFGPEEGALLLAYQKFDPGSLGQIQEVI